MMKTTILIITVIYLIFITVKQRRLNKKLKDEIYFINRKLDDNDINYVLSPAEKKNLERINEQLNKATNGSTEK